MKIPFSPPDITEEEVEQVAEALNVCRPCVYNLIKDSEILARRIGKVYRIPKQSVITFICGDEKKGA